MTTVREPGERWVDYLPLNQLAGNPRNPRRHNIPDLRDSIGRFGYADLIELDERTGLIVAGHGRRDTLRGLEETGARPPRGVRVDDHGTWLVPVLRGWTSHNDNEANGYAISNNRQTELGNWDMDMLLELLGEQDDLTGIGWNPDEIDRLLDPPLPGDDADQDDAGAGDDTGAGDDDQPAAAGIRPYGVVVVCSDAQEEAAVYEQLEAEGFDVRRIND